VFTRADTSARLMPDSSATFFASTAEHEDTPTYTSPTSGEPVGTSFLTPKTPDDLVKRRKAFKVWEQWHHFRSCSRWRAPRCGRSRSQVQLCASMSAVAVSHTTARLRRSGCREHMACP
jgi:hypothetical protein